MIWGEVHDGLELGEDLGVHLGGRSRYLAAAQLHDQEAFDL